MATARFDMGVVAFKQEYHVTSSPYKTALHLYGIIVCDTQVNARIYSSV